MYSKEKETEWKEIPDIQIQIPNGQENKEILIPVKKEKYSKVFQHVKVIEIKQRKQRRNKHKRNSISNSPATTTLFRYKLQFDDGDIRSTRLVYRKFCITNRHYDKKAKRKDKEKIKKVDDLQDQNLHDSSLQSTDFSTRKPHIYKLYGIREYQNFALG